MFVVTMNDIPGYRVTAVIGEVMGVTVRSRNMFSQMGAGFKSMVGGELKGMTANLFETRMEATTRMVAEAQVKGGNAIIAVRFDGGDLGGTWSELCAYGTAVVVEPITTGDAATPQSVQHAAQTTQQVQPAQFAQPIQQAQFAQPVQPAQQIQPTQPPQQY
jgi:uncharacterized protein YbjQ (UPF0145 family)